MTDIATDVSVALCLFDKYVSIMLTAPSIVFIVTCVITPAVAPSGPNLSFCIPPRFVPYLGPITASISPALQNPIMVSVP